MPAWAKRALPVLRAVLVAVIAWFLLGPVIKTIFRTDEKPVLIIAQDNSSSVIMSKDSVFYKGQYLKELADLASELSAKYEVQSYVFGGTVENGSAASFEDKQTDMSGLFDEISNRFFNRNVGAMILAGDGLFNTGSNPLYASTNLEFPVYTVAMGDTAIRRDLLVQELRANRIAFLGNDFPVEIRVAANKLKGKSTRLSISKGSEEVYSQAVEINNDDYSLTVPVMLPAKSTGLHRYRVSLKAVEGEDIHANNQKEFFIDVLDSRQKILIVASVPHPDVSAIVQAIGKNMNYEVQSALTNKLPASAAAYSLIVFHQVPTPGALPGSAFMKEITDKKISTLWITGLKTDFNQLASMQKLVQTEMGPDKISDVKAETAANFSLFNLSNEAGRFIQEMPPLQCRFGKYVAGPATQTFIRQKIGFVTTDQPLVVFGSSEEVKSGMICGEGVFRWMLHDQAVNGNTLLFDEIIGKTVQYLVVKADRSFFKVHQAGSFHENHSVLFDAEVYNESYEPVNDPDVSLTVYGENDKQFPFTFSRTQSAYRLDAGRFSPGNYRYEARVKVGEKVNQQKGEFSVAVLDAEHSGKPADHNLLYSLSKRNGGKMFNPHSLAALRDELMGRDDIKPVSHSEKKLSDLINLKWIFFLLLSLLSLEWFIRKYNGSY